ncbi:MAG: helix-turn-helix transcriptional regulator [Firmicutes bacterium]|nr:helix-turn-helix transcriptional regulator [Bacillota bacterium]
MRLETQKRIADNLRTIRLTHSLSQMDIAKFLGTSRTLYTHYEIGNRAQDAETLYNLSAFYGIEMSVFFEADHSRLLNILANDLKIEGESKDLLDMYNQLSPYSKGKLFERALTLLEEEQEKREKQGALRAAAFR